MSFKTASHSEMQTAPPRNMKQPQRLVSCLVFPAGVRVLGVVHCICPSPEASCFHNPSSDQKKNNVNMSTYQNILVVFLAEFNESRYL